MDLATTAAPSAAGPAARPGAGRSPHLGMLRRCLAGKEQAVAARLSCGFRLLGIQVVEVPSPNGDLRNGIPRLRASTDTGATAGGATRPTADEGIALPFRGGRPEYIAGADSGHTVDGWMRRRSATSSAARARSSRSFTHGRRPASSGPGATAETARRRRRSADDELDDRRVRGRRRPRDQPVEQGLHRPGASPAGRSGEVLGSRCRSLRPRHLRGVVPIRGTTTSSLRRLPSPSRPAIASDLTRSSGGSGPEAWARSTALVTRACGATSRSRSSTPSLATPEYIRRLDLEARTAGSLNHPNILAVFDVGTEGEVPYVVSELLEGESLRQRMDRGPIPYRKALEYGIQIASALAAAHEKGIRHRDVKPGQRLHHRRRPHQAPRLRPGQAGDAAHAGRSRRLHRLAGQPPGRGPRHRGVHVPGAGAGRIPGPPRGHLCPRHRAVRDAHRHARVPARVPGRDHERRAQRGAGRSAGGQSRPSARRPRSPCAAAWRRTRRSGSSPRATSPSTSRTSCRRRWARRPRRSAAGSATRNLVVAGLALAAVGGSGMGGARPPGRALGAGLPAAHLRPRPHRRRPLRADRRRPSSTARRWASGAPEVRLVLSGSPESRPLGHREADVLATRPGELALSIHRRFIGGERFSGTLATVPLNGGTPKELMLDVEDGDWDPSGTDFAVARSTGFGADELARVPGGHAGCTRHRAPFTRFASRRTASGWPSWRTRPASAPGGRSGSSTGTARARSSPGTGSARAAWRGPRGETRSGSPPPKRAPTVRSARWTWTARSAWSRNRPAR